jgi:hypothetical protein
MDLYGTSGQAIAEGNMRTQQVRDLNERIRQHNQDVADKIQGLREQTQTADTIKNVLDTGKTLWEGSKMPSAIQSYKDYKLKQSQNLPVASNVEEETNNALQASSKQLNPIKQAMTDAQSSVTSIGDTIAEGSPSGLSITEEAGKVLNGQGSKLSQGLTGVLENDVESSALSKLGKATGAIGGVTQAGLDLYQDFSGNKGFHLAGDNWEEKTGNALNLAGSVADVVGSFYPPAAIIGGALDLASAGIDAIGAKVSENKQSSQLTQLQQQETLKQVSAPPQDVITTGRTQ